MIAYFLPFEQTHIKIIKQLQLKTVLLKMRLLKICLGIKIEKKLELGSSGEKIKGLVWSFYV